MMRSLLHSRRILSIGFVCLVGALTGAAVTFYSSDTSDSAVVDGRTWTAAESEGISFSSRPVTGLFVIVQ